MYFLLPKENIKRREVITQHYKPESDNMKQELINKYAERYKIIPKKFSCQNTENKSSCTGNK